MGCFLACLGSSKNKKGKRLHSNRVPSGARDQRRCYNTVEQVVYLEGGLKPVERVALVNEDAKPAQHAGSPTEAEIDAPIVSASKSQNKAAEESSAGSNEFVQQEASPKKSSSASSPSGLCSRGREKSADKSSSGARKKVSFNSVVKTYEPVPSCELLDREAFSEDETTADLVKPNRSNSDSDAGSKTSSLGSYPPNHRYQNCRESDDEEELDDEGSDIDIDTSELEEDEYSDGDELTDSLCSMESTTRTTVPLDGRTSPEDNSHENIKERTDSNLVTRGRDGYDQSVLNPVENLTQWKALKVMGKKRSLQSPQKENYVMEFSEPPVTSFSHQSIFNQARSSQPNNGHPEHQAQQIAVDASLSNWLISPEPLNKPKASAILVHNVLPQQTTSQGSYSPRSFDDRPILGALTVEELKLLSSRTSSPRKSPSKCPDNMAIVGSVGSYWSQEMSDKGSPQHSSGKGNPNTTSKYREDMRVNWDSTPFETLPHLKQCRRRL